MSSALAFADWRCEPREAWEACILKPAEIEYHRDQTHREAVQYKQRIGSAEALLDALSAALDLDRRALAKLAEIPARDLEDARDELVRAMDAWAVHGCLNCGSPRVEWVEGDFSTGVVAPDGPAEVWCEQGWRCLDCGAIEYTLSETRSR